MVTIDDIDTEIAKLQSARDVIRTSLVELWRERDCIVKQEALDKDLAMLRDKHGVDFAPAQGLSMAGISSTPAVGAAKT